MNPRLVGSLFGAALALASCAPDLGTNLPPPPPTVKLLPTEPTTTAPDRSGQSLPVALGDPTTTLVELDNGPITMSGQVVGPDGPVPGATVRVERLVDDQSGSQDVTTGSNGRFVLANSHGGRMRVRAWRAPDLVQVREQSLFVTELSNIKLEVVRHNATRILMSQAPRQPIVGQQLNVAVLVVQDIVTAEGVSAARGVANMPVSLFATGAIRPNEASPKISDGSGNATFNLVCDQPGDNQLSFQLGTVDSIAGSEGLSAQLNPGACVVAQPPAPITAAPGSVVDPSALPPAPPAESTSPAPVSVAATVPP